MPNNPLNDLTDLGLVSPSAGDPLGDEGAIRDLQANLANIQSALQEPPPSSNNFLDAAIQGAIAGSGSRTILEDPLTGEQSLAPEQGGGFGKGFLTGMGAAIEGKQKEVLAQYLQRQRNAQAARDQQEKLSAGVRMVLAQNPLAFEALGATDEGRRTLGMLAYGMPVPVDPTAKAEGAEETLARKQLLSFYTGLMRTAKDPQTKAQAAARVQEMVDPDHKLPIDVTNFINGQIPTREQANKFYGKPGLRALEAYNVTGDVDAILATLSSLEIKDPDKMSAAMRESIELAGKMAEVIRVHREATGDTLTDEDAIKQLPEEDRIRAQKKFGQKKPGDIDFGRYVVEYGKALNDVPKDIREEDPAQAARMAFDGAAHAIEGAKKLEARMTRIKKKEPSIPVAPVKPSELIAPEKWKALVRNRKKAKGLDATMATKDLVNEYLQKGWINRVPADARKIAGL